MTLIVSCFIMLVGYRQRQGGCNWYFWPIRISVHGRVSWCWVLNLFLLLFVPRSIRVIHGCRLSPDGWIYVSLFVAKLNCHALNLVLCEYWKFPIESNSYFSIQFETSTIIWNFRILTVTDLFNRMMPIFHLSNPAYQPTKSVVNNGPGSVSPWSLYIGPLWPTKYWNSYNHNSAVP